MSGDYSRQRFEPSKHFSAVLMQQGRVQLDADWNEQGAILDRRWRAETTDLIGRCGVPKETPDGFKITAAEITEAGNKINTFTIGPGRIYVDGLLAENHGLGPLTFDQVLAELRGTTAVPYTQQPYFPSPTEEFPPGRHLVYLEVWQREVTALEDPTLLEPAVGIDSTARLQTVWQVKVLPNVGADVTPTTPDANVPGWSTVLQPSTGRLSTAADGISGVPEDPCLLPPGGGYAGVENQLYRVEIHDGGPLGLATFTWSRDNATVATQVLAIPAPDRLLVDSTGRDTVLRFNAGDWVEITDDQRELQGLPGVMRQLKTVDDATRALILEQPLPVEAFAINEQGRTNPSHHTRVRRWDQHGKVLDTNGNLLVDLDDPSQSGVIPIPSGPGTSIILEHGVRIAFDTASPDGPFRTGDYWVFATRTADASVEHLAQAPARGIHRHYCRLALIELGRDSPLKVHADCRQIFPHGLLAITTGEVLFESAPSGQPVISGLIDSGLGAGPVCVVLGMAQTQNAVVRLGHNAQAFLTADVEPPSGQFRVTAVRQDQTPGPLLVHWWGFRPERHLGQVVVSPEVVVTVEPKTRPVVSGEQFRFKATVTGATDQAVRWSVNNIPGGNATVGTISPQGSEALYQAPGVVPTPATVTVRATSVADSSKSGTATVTVRPRVVVTVTPETAPVVSGEQFRFKATVTGATDQAVRWSVNNIPGGNATVGTISPQGSEALYQAPGVVPPDPVKVRATSVEDSTKSGTATVTVQPRVSVTIEPATAPVTLGGQQKFTPFVSGTDIKTVEWSVTGPGSIDQDGLYKAPAKLQQTPATVTVQATSKADRTKTATATVTIPAVSVSVSPPAPRVIDRPPVPAGGRTLNFSASVNNATNIEVTWSAPDGGSITSTGPSTARYRFFASSRVIATSVADTTKSFTATVTVIQPEEV